ncbi:Serine/threonine-protein kinase/endoribonuclease IRE1a [Apostasia shenzhenica]|uniref:non-specific serine/threonine protein kinase n=1 Tax=Apostasia shenzhenica TaxID=1088818 RepID=A0A2H9ZXV7_9ASPA|nr:Serine/threonine-protein kinase/endoribonuclease IRE1a [Apostasia shenzhenica]
MNPPLPAVVLLLLLLPALVISGAANSPLAKNPTPELTSSWKELVVHEQSRFPNLRGSEAGSDDLASLGDYRNFLQEIPDSSSYTVSAICSAVEESDRLLLASLDGTVLSIDCKSGVQQWALKTGSPLSYSEHTDVDASGCFLYSGEDWNLYEYCTDTGFRKLNFTIEEYVHNSPDVRGHEVTIGSKRSTLYFLDADTGKELHKEQFPSMHPVVSAPNVGVDLVPSKLEQSEKSANYIMVVRTDYYLNSSALGKPLWNMMDSRISAAYINKEIPAKFDTDAKVFSPHKKDIPVYFPRKVNKAIMESFKIAVLPSVPELYDSFNADTQSNIHESLSPLSIPDGSTKNCFSGVVADQNVLIPEHVNVYSLCESSENTNKCPSGTCIMPKPSDNKMFYDVASLQSQSNVFAKGPFENVLGTIEDSFRLANRAQVDEIHGFEQELKSEIVDAYHGIFLFLFLSFITIVVMYWKAKEPSNHDKQLTNKGKISVIPKKKKARKAVNMKNSAISGNNDNIISSEKQNSESQGHTVNHNSHRNLAGLLSSNCTDDGKWIGKLFMSNMEIGRGSNGTVVFEGIYDGRAVAVKRLLHAHHDVAFKEIQNLIASDRHPNIVRWYGVEQDMDFVYIALEHCMCSLSDLIQVYTDSQSCQTGNSCMDSNPIKERKVIFRQTKETESDLVLWHPNGLPSSQLLKLMRDVVSGVAHLHELGIIHRDLKPQNVLISKTKIYTAKLSDMGISKRLLESMSYLSHNATGFGSSGWQAPEQLRHERQTRAVDLFSLGCILFFCLTKGEHPFGRNYERDLNILNNNVDLFLVDHIPEATDLLSKLLNPEPQLRLNALDALHHPLFWSSERRLAFLRDTSDRIELEDRENQSELLKALENTGPVAFGGKWGEKLDAAFISDMGRFRKYKFDSIRDLLRVVRNKLNHYRELPKELQEILGSVPKGFDQYFCSRFPRLLIEVYKVMLAYCREEDSFSKYFDSSLI